MKISLPRGLRRALATGAGRWYRLTARLAGREFSYLLILGHMRSGSTLLANLLASHPEILGYGETHIVYESPAQLRELAGRVGLVHRRLAIGERLVLDKVLHNGMLRRGEALAEEVAAGRVAPLFLLRPPERTLKSLLVHLGSTLPDAHRYYLDRLRLLGELAERFAEGPDDRPSAAFTTYDRLIAAPTATLTGLSAYLGLTTPLSDRYHRQPLADRKGVGDRSERIRAGHVLPRQRELEAELPPAVVAECSEAYARCLATLEGCCRSLPGS